MITLDAWQGWVDFWQKFADFFWKPDDTGINYLSRIGVAVAIIIFTWLVLKLFNPLLKKMFRVKKGPDIDVSAKLIILGLVKFLIWIAIGFIVCSVLKINLSGMGGIIASVGVALGLALQDLVGSFFSGLLIINQKTIRTGDHILVKNAFGECEGIVKRVHFFTTILTSFQGQKIIIPNKNMASAVITNYTVTGERRIDYDVGVSYDSDLEVVKAALASVIKDEPLVINPEKTQIYAESFGPYAINMRLRCWTKVDDYWTLYNQLTERIYLAFKEKGIYIPCSTDRNVQK